jgi:hypothetical protein
VNLIVDRERTSVVRCRYSDYCHKCLYRVACNTTVAKENNR